MSAAGSIRPTANLEAIRHIGVPAARIEKMANGMPVDARSFAMTRAEMGIADDAVVFALVARGIQRKGWRVAVNALKRLQAAHPDRSVHLLLVGEGELTDQVRKLADGLPNIHFLGYQTTIHGIYRLADVALAPTRFAGESYPLCLIQAMQTGAAVIASDVGEIAAMIRQNGRDAGLLVEAVRDTAQFEDNVLQAMERMLDNKLRNRLREGAAAIGETYAIEEVARRYAALYAQMVAEAAAHAKAA
jgi:glycosyltransferase involved in cell wall biosynthesis